MKINLDNLRGVVLRARLRLGCWIVGGDLWGYISYLTLVERRARAAITKEGRVQLADCRAVADVLYETTPGIWKLSISLAPPPETP